MFKDYKISYTKHSQQDVKNMRNYILKTFKYKEYANNFDKKIDKSIKDILKSPSSFDTIDFTYRNYPIYMVPKESYLFFYTIKGTKMILLRVLKDGMDWEYIIRLWLKKNGY